ncbi:MAG TPA: ISAs1 family transposase [Pseudonocardiaceae bacterium]|nr:ISAs1 family transposase [Pseudonocardiaceae bacterium]
MELLSLVPDPRKRRGVRHSLAAVLAIAAAAVLAGSRSVRAIGEWAAEAPPVVLAALGARYSPVAGRFRAPHIDTIRRVLRLVDVGAVDRVVGVFLAERTGIGPMDSPPGETGSAAPDGPGDSGPHDHHAQPGQPPRPEENKPLTRGLPVDGKAVRGAIQPDGRAVHLLAAMAHEVPAVLAQRDVAHKTNEITQVKPLLDPLELTGWAVTLDALHAQRDTARYLVEDKGAAYVFTAIKDNQPTLFAQPDALPWATVPIGHTSHNRGHGRQKKRTIQVLPAPDGIFPYARQAFLVERYVYDLTGTLTSAIAALGITALTAGQAGPERLAHLIRGHWGIEALHHIRDVTYDADRSQLRKGSAPQVLAGLRNLAIGALRTAGRTNIASSLRWISRDPTRALTILGQPA